LFVDVAPSSSTSRMLPRPRRRDVIPALSMTCSSSRNVQARTALTFVVVSGKWVSFVSGERRGRLGRELRWRQRPPATTASAAVTRRSACGPHCHQWRYDIRPPVIDADCRARCGRRPPAYGHDERGAGNALDHLTNGRALPAVEICPATRRRTRRATRIEQDDEAVRTVSREASRRPLKPLCDLTGYREPRLAPAAEPSLPPIATALRLPPFARAKPRLIVAEFRFDRIASSGPASTRTEACSDFAPSRTLIACSVMRVAG
jgi:hypothetical protein